MPLLSLRNVSFTWGGPTLLDNASIEVERGERIGLIGRNGAGKSTLMKIIDGQLAPDNGHVLRDEHLVIARLVQEVPHDTMGTVQDVVKSGVVATLEQADWQIEQAVERALSRLKLDGSIVFDTLSSGMKRRVLLARALVNEPDILLLDEPTNHLDIPSIAWLEGFLKNYDGTLIFVTHDRVFLQALANRIIEVDRGQLFDWTCDYQTFLHRKQLALNAEEKQHEQFDKKLAEEEVWIRQGIKARRTRNEGRVRRLKAMRDERRERRERIGNVKMQAVEAEKSGRLVIEAKGIEFSYTDSDLESKEPTDSDSRESATGVENSGIIIQAFSTLISRGDKIGIIGPNGAGKTTLLKLLLGDLVPTAGSIRHGTRLEVIYFDQLREQIDEEKTVVENVGEGQEMITINGQQRHIYGYLQDFLFTPERARRPARFLSGGERNRLLLARIFKRPSNVMVLDEPTNDLDAETLELLEELLANYEGTLLLVSHDRAFLNNVVTSTFVFEGGGIIKEYDGGYDDYIRQSATLKSVVSEQDNNPKPNSAAAENSLVQASGKKKLTYAERLELEAIPEKIEALELKQAALHETMSAPDFFKQDGDAIADANAELNQLTGELNDLMERWEDLESRS